MNITDIVIHPAVQGVRGVSVNGKLTNYVVVDSPYGGYNIEGITGHTIVGCGMTLKTARIDLLRVLEQEQ